jgi:hypothetical protein
LFRSGIPYAIAVIFWTMGRAGQLMVRDDDPDHRADKAP